MPLMLASSMGKTFSLGVEEKATRVAEVVISSVKPRRYRRKV
jgi:hypothetical protein